MVAEDEDDNNNNKKKQSDSKKKKNNPNLNIKLRISPLRSTKIQALSVPLMRSPSVRSIFSLLLLLLLLAAAILTCRFTAIPSFPQQHDNNNGTTTTTFTFESLHSYYYYSNSKPAIFDRPLLNSTLLTLSESDPGEPQINSETDRLLHSTLDNLSTYRPFSLWRRRFSSSNPTDLRRPHTHHRHDLPPLPLSLHSPDFRRIYLTARRLLAAWSQTRRLNHHHATSDLLLSLLRLPKRYSSCAVVGNSGILLNSNHGASIDAHEAVIRLNNARIAGFATDVGARTTVSFVNSNVLRECSLRRRRLTDDCRCRPYGESVTTVLYICQPLHFLDFASCTSNNPSSSSLSAAGMVVTDPRFDALCSRIVKYYSLKRYFFGSGSESEDGNRTMEGWKAAHDGAFFHYSSGLQAVMMAAGVCDKVSLFGFGKVGGAKHHYHTSQKKELRLHDYEAEYDFYRDLAERPEVVPFVGFKFPKVEIHY